MTTTQRQPKLANNHPAMVARDADMALIRKIVARAVQLYADYGRRRDPLDVLLDLTAVHFDIQKLRLQDLLDADPVNFMHDIAGIGQHLDRETIELQNGFTPRHCLRGA